MQKEKVHAHKGVERATRTVRLSEVGELVQEMVTTETEMIDGLLERTTRTDPKDKSKKIFSPKYLGVRMRVGSKARRIDFERRGKEFKLRIKELDIIFGPKDKTFYHEDGTTVTQKHLRRGTEPIKGLVQSYPIPVELLYKVQSAVNKGLLIVEDEPFEIWDPQVQAYIPREDYFRKYPPEDKAQPGNSKSKVEEIK